MATPTIQPIDAGFPSRSNGAWEENRVLEAVKKHPEAWPFVDPVQESFAPAYYDIIQHPMDISTVEVKVQEEMYRSKAKFVADVELIFSNCMEYNGPESEYTLMGANVASCFQEVLDQHFPPGTTSDSDLSDIASDQESAYRLSYPRELRRRSQALNYTELESPSDSGDTCKEEDEEEEGVRTKDVKVFPSYLSDKPRASNGQDKLAEKTGDGGIDGLKDPDSMCENLAVKSPQTDDKLPKEESSGSDNCQTAVKSPEGSSVLQGDVHANVRSPKEASGAHQNIVTESIPEVPAKKRRKSQSSGGEGDASKVNTVAKDKSKSPRQPKKKSPVKKKSDGNNKEACIQSGKKVKAPSGARKISLKKSSKTVEDNGTLEPPEGDVGRSGMAGGSKEDLLRVSKASNGGALTYLQKLEAITDKLGPCSDDDQEKEGDVANNASSASMSQVSSMRNSSGQPGSGSASKKLSGDESSSCSNGAAVLPPASPAARSQPPALKFKTEEDCRTPCSWDQQDRMTAQPPMASPLVVPPDLATIYNPKNLPVGSRSANPMVGHVFTSQGSSALSGQNHPGTATYYNQQPPQMVKVGDNQSRLDERSTTAGTKHASAFHSVGKDNEEGRTRLEQRSSLPAQMVPPQTLDQYSFDACPGSYGSPTSKGDGPFQHPKGYPSAQPSLVRPVSRYPLQAPPLRQGPYLPHPSAIANLAPNMGPQLNILQIASAPSLTLNIQQPTQHSAPMINMVPHRQQVLPPAAYRQAVVTGAAGGPTNPNDMMQKPALVVQYQGAPGGTPQYNNQYRTNYQ